ncbi:phosphoribosylglycinamide synthetase C domain-containing protein [Aminipila terrae]|uniref:phosphoribosylglycinamide synthetase C domain-containing protein n=1 Tax=Aminipila terrae TaxID=2697030 RepID=UPI002ED55C8E
MIGEDGPKVIEFNNRFGDPETQSVLLRLESDLFDIFNAVVDNKLNDVNIKWSHKKAVCVVLASGGYPGDYEKGKEIHGLNGVHEDAIVFHAGTRFKEKKPMVSDNDSGASEQENVILTDGGRVLGVAVLGDTHDEARAKAFENVKKISFEGMQYRTDIGLIVRK